MDQEDFLHPGCVRASRLQGADVYSLEGGSIGQIEDVVISTVEGRAVYVILSRGGDPELGERYHPLPWDTLTFDRDRHRYVVAVSREQLERAPSFDREHEPDWNDRVLSSRLTDHYSPPPVAALAAPSQ
jgi:sporulation protein YlmC with PRC-barrel domain